MTISILGSTGSIGRQTLEVASQLGTPVVALTAFDHIELLEQQTREFHPRLVAVYDLAAAEQLRERLRDCHVKVLAGMEGLMEAATLQEADTVVTAMVGMVGLTPTLQAVERGKRIALANKETLVCGGELIMRTADRYGAKIIPVDSEHSAIFQCLQGCQDPREIKQLILTCSGGPFYGKTFSQMTGVTSADALRHPNWRMGPKITVDCATLMNKGLEIIEAMRLYRLPPSQIQAVIHRQSIVHSMVEFRDGAILAQLGTADMRLPIRYALTYPNRAESPLPPLNLMTCPALTFAPPDLDAFPCLRLAMEAAEEGGTACTILNGANEAAVGLFLRDKIGFCEIPARVAAARAAIPVQKNPNLTEILEADKRARAAVLGE